MLSVKWTIALGLPKKKCPSSEMVGFLKKCQKVDPPKLAILGGVCFLTFFQKKHSKSLKLTLENGQKSGIYKVKFPKLQREDLPSIFGQISPLRPFHEYPPVQQVYHIYFCKKMVKNGIFLCPHSTHSALY